MVYALTVTKVQLTADTPFQPPLSNRVGGSRSERSSPDRWGRAYGSSYDTYNSSRSFDSSLPIASARAAHGKGNVHTHTHTYTHIHTHTHTYTHSTDCARHMRHIRHKRHIRHIRHIRHMIHVRHIMTQPVGRDSRHAPGHASGAVFSARASTARTRDFTNPPTVF